MKIKYLFIFSIFILLVTLTLAADYTLYSGWNLVASPFNVDVGVKQGLNSINGCFDGVFSYQEGVWKVYNTFFPFSNLDNISRKYGYWININCTEINWSAVVFSENCSNGFDDDLDGDLDCDDSDCIGDPACGAPDGDPCNTSTQCASKHCQNGFCCSAGDCCSLASDCPGSYSVAPVCDDSVTCQGHRMDASCTSYICGSSFIDDDTDCDVTTLSSDCGYYLPVHCNGQMNQSQPTCPSSCTSDSECDPNAHCDGTCQPDSSDGQSCDEDSDCASNHCQNGFCCAGGDCCVIAADCPGFYSQPPICDSPPTCQGHRMDASCTGYICGSSFIDDDSACDVTTLANACGYYLPVYCNGQISQTPPVCPTSCVSDSECEPNAHCDGTCEPDQPNGALCDEDSDCISNICFDGVCCNQYCSAANANLTCTGGTCSIDICIPPYADCDLYYNNGCEINTDTNVNHCGGCNNVCNLPYTSIHDCVSGTCRVITCDNHYANCDGNHANGCEVDLGHSGRTQNTCATAINLGTVCGDEGSQTVSVNSRGSKWYRVLVDECNNGIVGLDVSNTLVSPSGGDYDLLTYMGSCGSNQKTSQTGGTDCTDYSWSDTWTIDDSEWVYILVYHYSGSVCGDWALTVRGNDLC